MRPSTGSVWQETLGDEEKRTAYIDRVIHGVKTEEELAMAQVEAFWKAESEFKRGLAVFNQGRIKQAHDFFVKAHEAVPDELEFRAYYAFTTFKQAFQSGDEMAAEEAKDMLKDVLEKNKEQERKLDGGSCRDRLGSRERFRSQEVSRPRPETHPSNSDANRELRRITGRGWKPEAKKDEPRVAGSQPALWWKEEVRRAMGRGLAPFDPGGWMSEIVTHLGIDRALCGEPVELSPSCAVVHLQTSSRMGGQPRTRPWGIHIRAGRLCRDARGQ